MSVVGGCHLQAPQMYHHMHHALPRDFVYHQHQPPPPPPPPPSSATLPSSQQHHHQQQRYLPSMETLSAAASAAAASTSIHSSAHSSDNNNASSIAYFQNLMFNSSSSSSSSQYPSSSVGPDYATLSSSIAGGADHQLTICPSADIYSHSTPSSTLYMNYDELPLLLPSGNGGGDGLGGLDDGTVPRVRTVKRRVSSNRKERRRTHSINTAFAALRGCIPNVPSDTKLSKIKTLRLATSYIAYLMDILNKDDPKLAEGGFKADISRKIESREEKRKRESEEILKAISAHGEEKPSRGRTGWPQQVWAAELKQ